MMEPQTTICDADKEMEIEEKVEFAIGTSTEKDNGSNPMDESSDSTPVNASTGNTQLLSKRQLRKQEKIRQWKETQPYRKAKRRLKKKKFKERKKQILENLKSEAVEKGLEPSSITDPTSRKNLKQNCMKNSSCRIGICIDMSFNDLMIDKDLHKCVKQIHRCYSINRRYENPVQFYVTSFSGKSVEVMKKNDGWKNWDVHFSESNYLELEEYPKDNVVYLTAESENVLMKPEDNKLYVIGGLVDHNSKKGLCHQLAVEKGVQHARLPLSEFVEMNARSVLSIDHVFEILGGVSQKRPWEEVLMKVLPQRSQPKLKEDISTQDEGSSRSDDKQNSVEIKVEVEPDGVIV